MENNRKYSPELRAEAVLELLDGKRKVKEIVNEYEITHSTLRSWKKEVINRLPELLGRKSEADIQLIETKAENKKIKEQLEKTKLELDFLKRKRFLIKLLKKSGRV